MRGVGGASRLVSPPAPNLRGVIGGVGRRNMSSTWRACCVVSCRVGCWVLFREAVASVHQWSIFCTLIYRSARLSARAARGSSARKLAAISRLAHDRPRLRTASGSGAACSSSGRGSGGRSSATNRSDQLIRATPRVNQVSRDVGGCVLSSGWSETKVEQMVRPSPPTSERSAVTPR